MKQIKYMRLSALDKGTAVGFVAGLVLGYLISWKSGVSWLWNPAIGATITIAFGYIISVFIYKQPQREEIQQYTVIGQKRKWTFGKHEMIVLTFFVLQYVILCLIQF